MKRFTGLMLTAMILGGLANNFVLPNGLPQLTQVQVSDHVTAASFSTRTLTSYQIPKAVVQTILDNSLMSDGKTPTADGKTVDNFTIGDVQNLKVLSLATRTKNSDGTYTSKANAAVADWLESMDYATKNPGSQVLQTKDAVLGAGNLSDGKIKAQTFLQNGVPTYSDNQYYNPTPVLNILMAIINSATNATTLDLTGMLSKVPSKTNYGTVHMGILALLQTPQLTNLKTLNLGDNQIGVDKVTAGFDSNAYYLFRSTTLTSSSVTDLDLSDNGFTTLDDNILSGIGSQISGLNFAGNNITSISYNNGTTFSNASKSEGGSVNLSGSDNLDVSGNTAYVIASALNSGGASLTLDNKTANALATNQIANGNSWPGVNSDGFTAIVPQLSGDTVATIVDKNATAVTSNVLETIATKNVDALDSKTLTNLANNNASAITSNALSSIATNNAGAINSDVVSSVLAKQPDAITSDSLTAIAKNSGDALGSDVISNILTKQPDAITSDSLTAIAKNDGNAATLADIAKKVPDAVDSKAIANIAAQSPDVLTPDLVKYLAFSGALDLDTLKTIAVNKPDALTNLSDTDKQNVIEAAGGADKVGDVVNNPTSVPKSEATKPSTDVSGGDETPASKVTVDKTDLSFGTVNLSECTSNSVLHATVGLTVSGTLMKGATLSVAADAWQGADGTVAFKPTFKLDGQE
ncbi:hypothetical protein ACAW68_02230 [Weissella confusa]|uniref:hypothetical protein n=1 Tax=Weissella confusa TaxID=1583 RepID=UPI0035A3C3BC